MFFIAGVRMHHRFGTFTITTSIPLPNLAPAAPAPQGCVEVGQSHVPPPGAGQWNHHWWDGDEITLSLSCQPTGYWLRVPGLADFLVQLLPSPRIAVVAAPSTDESTLEHLLVDQVLPRTLSHAGELMLHASAIGVDGKLALFMGPSGWGKSTLAAMFARRGHRVLSDDCVQLVARDGRHSAIPTYPSLRLHSDSLRSLFPDETTLELASYSEKRRIALGDAAGGSHPARVHAIYLLGDPARAGDEVRITNLGAVDTCQALLRHSFRLDLADKTANAHQFSRCADVTRAVPAFRLDYPRDFEHADALVGRLIAHLASLSDKDPDRG